MAAIDSNSLIGEQTLLWQLSVFLNERNVLQGRPCKDLQLPADWSKDGVWELVKLASGCAVSRKGSKIPGVAHPDLADVDFADLYLEANHSEARATVRSRQNAFLCKSCIVLFALSESARCPVPEVRSDMETPPTKRQKQWLALQDDEEADVPHHEHAKCRKIASRCEKKAATPPKAWLQRLPLMKGCEGANRQQGQVLAQRWTRHSMRKRTRRKTSWRSIWAILARALRRSCPCLLLPLEMMRQPSRPCRLRMWCEQPSQLWRRGRGGFQVVATKTKA